MPPKIRITKDQIIHAALDIVREKGAAALNARSLAKKLDCSTGPLFRDFKSMNDIKEAVLIEAYNIYSSYIEKSKIECEEKHMKKYKGTGMAYLKFARDEKELFKLTFMQDRANKDATHVTNVQNSEFSANCESDPNLKYVIQSIVEATGLSFEQAEEFHFHSWVYSHGLASMIATNFLEFSDEQLSEFLSIEFQALLPFYKNKQN